MTVRATPGAMARGNENMSRIVFLLGIFAGCVSLLASGPALNNAAAADASTVRFTWRSVQPGLELARIFTPDASEASSTASPGAVPGSQVPDEGVAFVFVRIDPSRHVFSLHMASEDAPARSLGAWASRHKLEAAVNAGMYLPDMVTSTGYMRGPGHMNHARMGERLGAFFVANPRTELPEAERRDMPQADIIERGDPQWQERLEKYSLVVQNYRLISRDGSILWPEGGEEHSIAAIGRDRVGRILFILCETPVSPAAFAADLLRFPLSLGSVMYVEGGAQAGIFLQDGASAATWMGRFSILNTRGSPHIPLPNVIGVRSRQGAGAQ